MRYYGYSPMIKNINSKHSKGYTIIELMIAAVLGLVLLLGVMQIYLASTQTNRLQAGAIEVQDRGRFLLAIIEKDLQRAGWRNFDTDQTKLLKYVNFSGSDNDTEGDGLYDSIQIEYDADDEDDLYGRDDDLLIDKVYNCGGTEVTRGITISNQYVIDITDDNDALNCNSREYLRGVDSFQILYGVDNNVPQDGIIDGYMDADQINANTSFQTKVIAVRIGFLLRSSPNILDVGQRNINKYQVLDVPFTAPGDRKLRRLFTKTIMLPNHPLN